MTIRITDHSTGKTYCPRPQTIEAIRAEKEEYGDKLTLQDILDLAARHWYGRNCGFFRNQGLADQGIYGQIVRPCRTGGLDCVTPQIRFTVETEGE